MFGTPLRPVSHGRDPADSIKFFDAAELAAIRVATPTKQAAVNKKLSAFLELCKTQPGYESEESKKVLDQLIAQAKTGLCFGYSICFSSMFLQRKHLWWLDALSVIASWDETEASLRDVYHLGDTDKLVKMRELFERVLHYVLYHQSHFFKLPQLRVISPVGREDFSYYEMTTEEGRQRIQDIRLLYYAFDTVSLAEALDESCLEGRPVLITGTYPPNKDGKVESHTIAVHYRDHHWYLYDSNQHRYIKTCAKAKLIEAVLKNYTRVHELAILDFKGRVALSDSQRKYAEFNNFLAYWKSGMPVDASHHYLLEHRGIKNCIKKHPAKMEEFFLHVFSKDAIYDLSSWQREAAITCLLTFGLPSFDLKALILPLCMHEHLRAETPKESFLQHLAEHSPTLLEDILEFVGKETRGLIWIALYQAHPESFWKLLNHRFEVGNDFFLEIFASKNSEERLAVQKFLNTNPLGLIKIYQHCREYFLRQEPLVLSVREFKNYLVEVFKPSTESSPLAELVSKYPTQFLSLSQMILKDFGARFLYELLNQPGKQVLQPLALRYPTEMGEFAKMLKEGLALEIPNLRFANVQFDMMIQNLSPTYFLVLHPPVPPAPPARTLTERLSAVVSGVFYSRHGVKAPEPVTTASEEASGI